MAHEYLKYVGDIPPVTLQDLMLEHGQDVWNYAFLLTRNHHAADDISQDVFLQAYLHIDSFRGQSSVKTWLISITRNRFFNYKKSSFIRRITLLDYLHPAASTNSAEEEYIKRTYTDSIWQMVMKLPHKYREVLVLDAKYELPLAEIASMLQVSIGTVKSRLHRARAKMNEYLKEAEGYEGK